MPDTKSPPPRRVEHLSRVRLFVGDSVIALGLLNEARHRIVSRSFGISREHSNLMTLFVIATFVRGLQRAAAAPGTQVRKARSSPTAVGDTIIGTAVAKEAVNSIAGHPARDTPSAAALIALAMAVYAFRAGIKRLLHAVRPLFRNLAGAAHRVRAVMRRWGISPLDGQMSPGRTPAPSARTAPTETLPLRARSSTLPDPADQLEAGSERPGGAVLRDAPRTQHRTRLEP
jgi:hypothetical protein